MTDEKKTQKKVGARRVISYFRKMTMTRKLPFILAVAGMIISSLANLALPLYYTRIIDIVQASTGSRIALLPILM